MTNAQVANLSLPPRFIDQLSAESEQPQFSPRGTAEEFEELWKLASEQAATFPAELSLALSGLRAGRGLGALVVSGFPVDDPSAGPTRRPTEPDLGYRGSWRTAQYLLSVANHLGEVFAFERQHNGDLIQDVVPIKADRFTQRGTGSRVFLQWHTEDSFDRLRADFVLLFCVRGDPGAATQVVTMADVELSNTARRVLAEPRFYVGIDLASGGSGIPEDGPLMPIIARAGAGDWTVRVDTDLVAVADDDPEANDALREFQAALPRVAKSVTLAAGDVLIIDNKRTLHARTGYYPRFDGTDRWLQRVSVSTNFHASAAWRTKRKRVVDLEARNFG